MRWLWLLAILLPLLACIKSAYAFTGTGGECEYCVSPIRFSTSCKAINGGEQYRIKFKAVNATSPVASHPLVIVNTYIMMGRHNIQVMEPTLGLTNSSTIVLDAAEACDYSFIYTFVTGQGTILRCRTQTFDIASCR